MRSKKYWKKILALPSVMLLLILCFVGFTLASDSATAYTRLINVFIRIIPQKNRSVFSKIPEGLSENEWRQDIQYLKEELPKHHANLFLNMKAEEFNFAIAELEKKIGKVSDAAMVFEISRIISMIKDGHTQVISVAFNMPAFVDSRLFPLRIFHFQDGIYVTDAGRDHLELKGSRITKIGHTPIEDVVEKINLFVPGENDYYKRQWAFPYLLNANLLAYCGVIKNEKEASFTFVDHQGNEQKKKLTPVLAPFYLRWFRETLHLDDLSRKNRLDKNYWFEYDTASSAVFFQLNQINNQEGEPSIKEFAQQLNKFVNQNTVKKFVVDVRNCNGGDNTRIGPLVTMLSNNSKINQSGTLFVLIGRQTFSAAVSFISALERNTQAIFTGEPSGSGPNQCGDVQVFVLPNSKLVLQVSSRYHQQSIAKDRRLQINVTLPIMYAYKNWVSNVDPAMVAVEHFSMPSSDAKKTGTPDSFDSLAISGSYAFDYDKVLTVRYDSGKFKFEIKDFALFASGGMSQINKQMYISDNGRVSMEFLFSKKGRSSMIILDWNGVIDTISRLPDDNIPPSDLLKSGNITKATELYKEGKQKGFVYSASTEIAINTLAYKYVTENKLDEAIDLFSLNTFLFPSSGNVWDSLAEAWLKKGDKVKAKRYYLKSLVMNPENDIAKAALENL